MDNTLLPRAANRRAFLSTFALAGASVLPRVGSLRHALAQNRAPAVVTSDRMRPAIPYFPMALPVGM